MLKLNDSLNKLISNNNFLVWGMNHKLFNLSQLSKFLKPKLELHLKKSISDSAILMALSRQQNSNSFKTNKILNEKIVKTISILNDLVILTIARDQKILLSIIEEQKVALSNSKVFTFTEGVKEINIIADKDSTKRILSKFKKRIIRSNLNATGIYLQFSESAINSKGTFFLIFQELYFHNINIIDISSTATELIILISEEDAALAVNSIFNKFASNKVIY